MSAPNRCDHCGRDLPDNAGGICHGCADDLAWERGHEWWAE